MQSLTVRDAAPSFFGHGGDAQDLRVSVCMNRESPL